MSLVLGTDVFEDLLQERSGPVVTGVALDAVHHARVPLFLFSVGHVQTLVDRMGDTEQVVRVDLQGRGKGRSGTHEFGQDERRLVRLVLTEDKLHRRGVHTVTERSDEGQIGSREQTKVFVSVDSLMATGEWQCAVLVSVRFYRKDASSDLLVMNGSVVKSTVSTVDVADELGDLGLEVGLLGQGRGGDLDEDDLAPPFRVDLQELFESLKFVVDTLGDVELFSADNDLFALVERTESHRLRVDSRSITITRNREQGISVLRAARLGFTTAR